MKRIATSLLSPSLSLAVAGLVSLSLAGCPELPFMGDTVDIQPPHPNPGPALVTETDPDAPFPNESPAAPQPLAAEAAPAWSSGRALALNDGLLYAVDSANEDLVVLDVTTEMVVRRINLDSFGPQQVAVGPDGTAFVTLRYGYSVARIAPGSATATTQLVGAEPIGIALSPDAAHVFVTVAGEDALVVLDAVTLQQEARVNTIVRPRTVALDAAGNSLVVAGQDRVAERFSVQYVGGLVQLNSEFPMMLRTTSPADAMLHFARPQAVQANRARGSVALPGSNSMLVVHEQAMTGTEADSLAGAFAEVFPEEGPESSGGYGGGGGSKFSDAPHILRPLECSVTTVGDAFGEADGWPVRDGQTGRPMTGLIAQPSDINHHPTWSIALVTGHGSDNVLVLNTGDTDPMRSPLGIIEVGQAPRAVVFDPTGERAYVLSSQSFEIDVINLEPYMALPAAVLLGTNSGFQTETMQQPAFDPSKGVAVIPARTSTDHSFGFGTDPLPQAMRLGRRTYTFARNPGISKDSQFACASCHYDGREDGLAWFVPGGPRQTPQLAGRLLGTGPFNWLGTETQLKSNMVETIHRMGGEGLSESELTSLEKFLLEGLRRPVNPNTLGPVTAAQDRGRALFFDPQVGCASCHVGGEGSDGQLHDVGTASNLETEVLAIMGSETGVLRFNTPSLRDLFATAPYLHDGSAPTLRDALDRTAATMGNTAMLSVSQKDDLVAYLLTL